LCSDYIIYYLTIKGTKQHDTQTNMHPHKTFLSAKFDPVKSIAEPNR